MSIDFHTKPNVECRVCVSYNRLFWKELITADANADVVAAKNTELPTFSLKLITFSSVWVNISGALPGIVFNAGRNEIVPLTQIAKKSCIYILLELYRNMS